jgi:DeoR/GlpR family transcriptional regulator of sugar metabolism
MLPTQRRRAILAERQTQAVSAEDLAQRFGVSCETIRRDLRGLRDRSLPATFALGPPQTSLLSHYGG